MPSGKQFGLPELVKLIRFQLLVTTGVCIVPPPRTL